MLPAISGLAKPDVDEPIRAAVTTYVRELVYTRGCRSSAVHNLFFTLLALCPDSRELHRCAPCLSFRLLQPGPFD